MTKYCECGCGKEVTEPRKFYSLEHYHKWQKTHSNNGCFKKNSTPWNKNTKYTKSFVLEHGIGLHPNSRNGFEKHGNRNSKKQSETKKRLFKEGKIKIWNKDIPCSNETIEKIKRALKEWHLHNKHPIKVPKKIYICKQCGKFFKNYESQIKGKLHFCKKECYNKFSKGVCFNTGKTHFKKGHDSWIKYLMPWEQPGWLGGLSFGEYGLEFNNKLKEQVRKRDNHRCQECGKHQDELRTVKGKKYRLHIHHIDYDKKNCSLINLLALCNNCHIRTNHNRKDWTEYFQQKIKEKNKNEK